MFRGLIYKRCFSGVPVKYHNNLEFLFAKHSQALNLPFFSTRSGNIEILKEPIDFYVNLHQGIRSSHERIVWSSLYFGTGNLEKFLITSLSNKLKKTKSLKCSILLDFSRGTRFNNDGESSRTILTPLKTDNLHNPHLKIGFFRNPIANKYISLLGKGGLREIFGTHHLKVYIFDNNVIISGANLQESYFTERQDRYILFKNVPELANFLDDFIQTLTSNSYQMEDNGDLNVSHNQPDPLKGKEFSKTLLHQFKMFLYSNKADPKEKTFEEAFGLYEDDDYKTKFSVSSQPGAPSNKDKKNVQKETKESGTQKEDADVKITDDIKERLFKEDEKFLERLQKDREKAASRLQKSFDEIEVSQIVRKIESTLTKKKEDSELVDLGGKVYLFPFIQFPPLKYDEDSKFFTQLIWRNCENKKNHIKLSLGYMNMVSALTDSIENSKAKVELLTCSPMANGFYNAGFFKKWIPYFYRCYEFLLLRALKKKNNDNVSIHEYTRGQWTFHSKGIWIYENNESHPSFSSIGSSNFSYRSYFRDTELNLYFYTQCPKFKEELHFEALRQFQQSENVTSRNLRKDPNMKFGWTTVLLSKIFSSFL